MKFNNSRVCARRLLSHAIMAAAATLGAVTASAQTDYYNTDAGRPLHIEDAYPTERYAFELKVASFSLERLSRGRYNAGLEPEIAYGVLPRTHIEIGFPLAFADLGDGSSRSGIAGLELSAFHNLNVETRTLPALGLRADLLFPVGALGPDRTYTALKGIATRTFSIARIHLNGQYTFGKDPAGDANHIELPRWLGGVAVDKTLPLKSLLLSAGFFAKQSLERPEDHDYNVEAGFRYQTSPSFLLDAGLGHTLTGPGRAWSFTFGTTWAFAARSLMPVRSTR